MEANNGYISTEDSYGPYLNAAGWCHSEKVVPGARMDGYVAVPKGNMNAFNDALTRVGPLSVGIDATSQSLYYYAGEWSQGVAPVCLATCEDNLLSSPRTCKRRSLR